MNNCSFKRRDTLKTMLSSCHPKHCLKSIPFSQAIRVKRICSTVKTTKQRLGDLRHDLKRRDIMKKLQRVRFQRPVKLTKMTSWSTMKKRSTHGFPIFSLYHPLQRKFQALSVIIGNEFKKVKRWSSCSLTHPLYRSGYLKH